MADNMEWTYSELQQLMDALFETVIVTTTDLDGNITSVNKEFQRVSKYSEKELLGNNHRIVNSGYHPKAFFRDMLQTIHNGKKWSGDVCNRTKDGSLFWLKTVIVPLLDDYGKPYKFLSFRTDITDQMYINEIKKLAYYDELTSLPNRRLLEKRVQYQIEYNEQKTIGLLYVNINRFKLINQGYGYPTGNQLLVQVASRLKSVCGDESTVYRNTSDEFIIILDNALDIDRVASKTIDLFKQPFIIDSNNIFVNVSIGGCTFPDEALSFEDLIRNAFIALRKARTYPNSHYLRFEPYLDTFPYDITIETKLRQAIEQDTLQLYYQPKMDLRTGTITGAEALLRWNDNELGYIPPSSFIPLAEESGLILELGEWVIKTAVRQIEQWKSDLGIEVEIAINISPIQLNEVFFIDKVKYIIEKSGINPSMLRMEITEYCMMNNTDEVYETLMELKRMGIQISIDDFGTGYSSFQYLKTFPIDELKIDQSFIQGCDNSKDIDVVNAIIVLGHALHLQIVAEGVETEKELHMLKEHGCDIIQGYYFSKPLTVHDITKKLAESFIHLH
ncbi:EAL domain-containing protein [Bacillus sp. 1P06AnD]|uniref:sensor domain-containing protein n=1 Tax=Bacillus sp. 1P06AnD TaxID=3132208 RepID=UPI00399F3DED